VPESEQEEGMLPSLQVLSMLCLVLQIRPVRAVLIDVHTDKEGRGFGRDENRWFSRPLQTRLKTIAFSSQ
jgi:hypothetical protein